MLMPGRNYSPEKLYRYSYNKQEKADDVAGVGNHTTAKYWEYDTRLGKRWNLDPIYNTDISRYSVNGNNPNYYLDPYGDFRTKFGARVYKFFHGGNIGQNRNKESKHYGEWYVSKKIEGLKGQKGAGSQADGSTELDEVVVGVKQQYSWKRKSHPANGIDIAVDGVNRSVDYLQKNASGIWNSPIARTFIPDYFTVSGNFQTSSGIYINEELTFTLLLRGRDPGLYFNTTTGFGAVSSAGVDVGFSIGKGYYWGDSRKLSSMMLGGWQTSGAIGVGLKALVGGSVNGGVDVGFDDNGKPITTAGKVGVSIGLGVSTPILQGSLGTGKATNAMPIFKF